MKAAREGAWQMKNKTPDYSADKISKSDDYTDPKRYDKKGKIIYPGRLGKKIDLSNFTLETMGKVYQEHHDMMQDLMELFEIDCNNPECWKSLSYRLAGYHVPGFMFVENNKGGAPKKIFPVAELELFLEVREKVNKNGCTVSAACGHVFNDKKKFSQYTSKASLASRYYAFVKKVKENPQFGHQATKELFEKRRKSKTSHKD